jgi:hypothetical protein
MLDIITTLELLSQENTDKGKKEILLQADEFSKWVFKQTILKCSFQQQNSHMKIFLVKKKHQILISQ